MTALWATVAVVALLLPGVTFFHGFYSKERYSRELIRSNAIGEVGMALFVALLIHFLLWTLLSVAFGFDASFWLRPMTDSEIPNWLLLDHAIRRLWWALVYVLIASAVAWPIGYIIAKSIMFGRLRQHFATHPWAYDLIADKNTRVVRAYVLTTAVESDRALMYSGHLESFYLDADGCFSYLVLKNCHRYYMMLGGDKPSTGERSPLFRDEDDDAREWEHLVISGENIANVLFDPLGTIQETKAADARLREMLNELRR